MTAPVYHARGWIVVPIPARQKRPTAKDWPALRLTADQVLTRFVGQNVGVHLGPSGLIDVDLDCPEAVELAPHVLPQTATFGRASKPRSHWIYAGQATYRKFVDPLDGACLLEIRAGEGKQSVFPGSVHESGEVIEWYEGSDPIAADPSEAAAQLAVLAWCRKHGTDDVHPKVAAWLGYEAPEPADAPDVMFSKIDDELIDRIAEHYPSKGSRHDYRLACAGAMWRAGVSRKAAASMLQAATERVGADWEPACIEDTWSATRPNTGSATLVEMGAKAIADRIDALVTPEIRSITWLDRLDETCIGGNLTAFDDAEIVNGLARMVLGKDSRLPGIWARLKDAHFTHWRELKATAEARAQEIRKSFKADTRTTPATHPEADGMVLPPGYVVENGRLMLGEELVMNGELLLLAKCPTSAGVYARIAFRAPERPWQTSVVPYRSLVDTRGILVLAEHGANVSALEGAAIVGYVRDYVAANGDTLDRPIATRTGWHESGAFVLGREVIGGAPELRAEYAADNAIGLQFVNALQCHGDRGAHLDALRAVVKDFPVAATCLAASLAAPLVTRLGRPTVAIHVSGIGGSGKTRALKVAGSVWGLTGTPGAFDAGGIIYGANSTARAFEIAASARSGLPFLASDLVWSEYIGGVLHQVVNGAPRGRATAHGGSTIGDRYECGAVLTEGEVGLKSRVAHQGFHRRITELEPDPNPGRLAALAGTLSEHCGHLGREFLEALLGADVAPPDGELPDALGHELRTTVGSLLATIEIAAPLLGVKAETWIGHVLQVLAVPHAARVAAGEANEIDRALDALHVILATLPIADNADCTRNREGGRPWAGYRSDDGETIVVVATVLRDELQRAGHSATNAVLAGLAARGVIVSKDGAQFAVKRAIGSAGAKPRCYEIRLGA